MKQKNRIIILLKIFIIILPLLYSCRSSKDFTYMQNIESNEEIGNLNQKEIEYQLMPGDILYVNIRSMNDDANKIFNINIESSSRSGNSHQMYTTPQGAYLYGYEIDTDGFVKLPLMGKIKLQGYTQREAEQLVQEKAVQFFKDAIIKVKLLNYKITVMGEVRSPGIYYNYSYSLSVLEAIAMANGNTDYANIKTVTVLRTVNDTVKAIKLDLSDKNIWLQEGYFLYPNDYVLVEPDNYKMLQLNSQALSMGFSSLSIILSVLGLIF